MPFTFTVGGYPRRMEKLADTFWNIRGVYRVGGVLDIGTRMSLVQRTSGRFVFLDGCALDGAQREAVMALTGNGERVEAMVQVYTFHTLHVEALHRFFSSVALYV